MYVYLLHFEKPIAHAQHYVGSTGQLHNRLKTHAKSSGAKITAEAARKGIEWHLAGLWQTTAANARRNESYLKKLKNTPEFCQRCCKTPKNLPGCHSYPLTKIPFPTSSAQLLSAPNQKELFNTDPWHFTFATERDTMWIIKLAADERHQLGFIPQSGVVDAIERQRIIIARVGKTKVGFLTFTTNHKRDTLKFQQCVIHDECRLQGIGQAMVNAVAAMYPHAEQWARVREDLPANFFWQKIGFQRLRSEPHKTSEKIINVYHRGRTL